jgi:hypothetical protein
MFVKAESPAPIRAIGAGRFRENLQLDDDSKNDTVFALHFPCCSKMTRRGTHCFPVRERIRE